MPPAIARSPDPGSPSAAVPSPAATSASRSIPPRRTRGSPSTAPASGQSGASHAQASGPAPSSADAPPRRREYRHTYLDRSPCPRPRTYCDRAAPDRSGPPAPSRTAADTSHTCESASPRPMPPAETGSPRSAPAGSMCHAPPPHGRLRRRPHPMLLRPSRRRRRAASRP